MSLNMLCRECRQSVNMLVKLLVSIDRRQGHKEAKDTLDLVVKVNQMYPDIVVGLDLSGDPSQGDFMEFLSVLAEARRYGLRLSIHCAEMISQNLEENMLANKLSIVFIHNNMSTGWKWTRSLNMRNNEQHLNITVVGGGAGTTFNSGALPNLT
ncbi:unnamed protein product [Timema podura]|uniref:Adenosine deaminase-like protein n=1 Tax=Timema podura TaxID=61482 RepID=A0ABN7NFX5_TIMPD|nr:unnamed protein product [Timema podura]